MLVVTVGVLVVLAAVDVAITAVALVARPPSAGDLAWVVVEAVTRVSLLAALGAGLWRGRPAERPVAALLGVLVLIVIPVVLGFRPPSGAVLAGVVGEVLLVAVLLVLVTRPRVRVLWPDPAEQSVAEQAWSQRRAERAGMPWWRRIRQALLDDRTTRSGTRPGRQPRG